MKHLATIICILVAMTAFSAHAASAGPQVKIATSKGDIIVELDAKAAPKTVANFLAYVREGFYNGTIFHRVIKNFMIQGGGLTADMNKKQTRAPVANEADNGLRHHSGTIAMARTNAPHSATSQFFINVKSNPFLNHRAKTMQRWGYCVFGKVAQGMDVVKAIENVPTGAKAGRKDVPTTPVIINSITLLEPQPAEKKK